MINRGFRARGDCQRAGYHPVQFRKSEPADHVQQDREAGRVETMAEAFPESPSNSGNRIDGNLSGSRCRFVDRAFRKRGASAPLANDGCALRKGRSVDAVRFGGAHGGAHHVRNHAKWRTTKQGEPRKTQCFT